VKRGRLLELIVLSLLGALTYGAKMAMAALPNIEPVTLLILVYTLVFGKKALYPIYIYVLLEVFTWGLGLWNLNYFYIWLVPFFLALAFRKMESPWGWAILSGAYGLSFGLLCAPVYAVTGGFYFAVSWWISGIPFDVLHCVGNFGIALVLVKPLRKVLDGLKRKYLQ
jgi:energy-coupling factor transport system substrate-specific component